MHIYIYYIMLFLVPVPPVRPRRNKTSGYARDDSMGKVRRRQPPEALQAVVAERQAATAAIAVHICALNVYYFNRFCHGLIRLVQG